MASYRTMLKLGSMSSTRLVSGVQPQICIGGGIFRGSGGGDPITQKLCLLFFFFFAKIAKF